MQRPAVIKALAAGHRRSFDAAGRRSHRYSALFSQWIDGAFDSLPQVFDFTYAAVMARYLLSTCHLIQKSMSNVQFHSPRINTYATFGRYRDEAIREGAHMRGAVAARADYLEEDEVINRYAMLVKRIARHLMTRLPRSVQLDDLVQAGLIGLMEAVRHYDPEQGAGFETYATIRVRGAMLDELRRNDWSPRSLSRRVRQLSDATHDIESEKGRAATSQEIADRLNLSLNEYHQRVLESNNQNFFSLDDNEEFDFPHSDEPDSTYRAVEGERRRTHLSEAIRTLSEREQMVLSLYYDKDMTMKEIGQILEVSESRVCQIHGEATLRLKSRMGVWRQ